MSRIYFHSPSEESEAAGPERHLMGIISRNVFEAMLGVNDINDPIMRLIPDSATIRKLKYDGLGSALVFRRDFGCWLSGYSSENKFVVGEIEEDVMSAAVNTMLVMGSDALAFVARCHAQCEVHAYVEGQNRKWLAGIIEQAVDDCILRKGIGDRDMGWSAVIEMLRRRDDEPVVTSYSVCEQFPNASAAGWEDEAEDDESESLGDRFDGLPEEKRWRLAMAGIRKIRGLEWKPETWRTDRFGHGFTAFTLREAACSLVSEASS